MYKRIARSAGNTKFSHKRNPGALGRNIARSISMKLRAGLAVNIRSYGAIPEDVYPHVWNGLNREERIAIGMEENIDGKELEAKLRGMCVNLEEKRYGEFVNY